MSAQTILPTDKPMITTTRVINAPRNLVFKVLTDPNHICFPGCNGRNARRLDGNARWAYKLSAQEVEGETKC